MSLTDVPFAAALKCRQRKKAWLANLQSKVEFLTQDNDTLQSTVQNLKDEISSLRSILSQHTTCSMGPGGDRRASQTMGMMGMQQQQQQQHQFAAANGGRY
jgi:ATF/CREB family transcription factor